MTIATLTFVLANFCGIKDINLPKQEKLDCIEYMVNCAIVEDGRTMNKLVNMCKEEWADKHNNLTRGAYHE